MTSGMLKNKQKTNTDKKTIILRKFLIIFLINL